MRSQNPSSTSRSPRLALVLALLFAIAATACARADADVQADLQQQLSADSATASITATVADGIARLSGVTQTQAQQDRALAIARSVKGVKEVDSAMRMDDAALTEAVQKAIAADQTVSAVPLRIEVRDGEVRLFSDKTNADQRTKLAQIAGAVYGVTHVEDNMK
jgi:osmotically-inducible protein OsmY